MNMNWSEFLMLLFVFALCVTLTLMIPEARGVIYNFGVSIYIFLSDRAHHLVQFFRSIGYH